VWLGRIPFDRTAALQERLRTDILTSGGPETLLLCEHDPVITLGRNARPQHVLAAPDELARRGIALRQATRGGDVTYHGPGQLVGYPVFRLRNGLVVHMQKMAAAIVEVLAALGISGQWRRDRPGVWVGADKICAFGVHVRHRVAIHGFALNVTTPAEAFAPIVPCGLTTGGVTSIARLQGRAPALGELAHATAEAFERSFGLMFRPAGSNFDPESFVLPVANPNERSIE
jgi:lipoyl(octanoyl) transferase